MVTLSIKLDGKFLDFTCKSATAALALSDMIFKTCDFKDFGLLCVKSKSSEHVEDVPDNV